MKGFHDSIKRGMKSRQKRGTTAIRGGETDEEREKLRQGKTLPN